MTMRPTVFLARARRSSGFCLHHVTVDNEHIASVCPANLSSRPVLNGSASIHISVATRRCEKEVKQSDGKAYQEFP